MILTPAYGRDYKSKAAVQADMSAGKDFIINDIGHQYDGKPINLEQLKEECWVTVRYNKLTRIAIIKVK